MKKQDIDNDNENVLKNPTYWFFAIGAICCLGTILFISLGIGNWFLAQRIERAIQPNKIVVIEPTKSDIIVSGLLDGQVGSRLYETEAKRKSLIIYAVQKWDVSCDKDLHCSGSWHREHTILPKKIVLNRTVIMLDSDKYVAFDKIQVKTIVFQPGSGTYADGHNEGSLRLVGYKQGCKITLLGKCNVKGVLEVDRVFGDTYYNYIPFVSGKASSNITIGLILASITILLTIILTILLKKKIWKF